MKASSVVLLAAVFVSVALPTTNAVLRCYVCTSTTSSNCGKDASEIEECGGLFGSCVKVTDGSTVVRSCGLTGSGCTSAASVSTCSCSTDACNVATVSTTPSRVMYVAIPLAVITKLISRAIM